jgi:cyclohexanone monooxygenase
MTIDGFPNLFLVGNNVQTVAAVNAVHLLDEQAIHLAYLLSEARDRGIRTLEADPTSVDAYVDLIRSSAKNQESLKFFAQCTPGYYNAEGRATRSADLFSGDRFGDGALVFFDMLRKWRTAGTFEGLRVDASE